MGCCVGPDDDPVLAEWVASSAYAAPAGTHPLFPVKECRHDPADVDASDLLCSQCQAAVTLKFSLTPHRCENLGEVPLGEKPDVGGVGGGAPLVPPSMPKWLGLGGVQSARRRCDLVTRKMELGGFVSDKLAPLASRVCHCLGCCDVKENDPNLNMCLFPT